jgi:hypothetical protein
VFAFAFAPIIYFPQFTLSGNLERTALWLRLKV